MNSIIKKTDHYRGSAESPVVLIEYGDFECKPCGELFPELEQLVSDQQDMCFVFRHYPLRQIHPNAQLAAIAAEAAGRQGKFWEMHRALFENQADLSEDKLTSMAKSLHLDMEKFNKDLNDKSLIEKIENDMELGTSDGVVGTPTLFINGYLYDLPRTYEDLKETVTAIAERVESAS